MRIEDLTSMDFPHEHTKGVDVDTMVVRLVGENLRRQSSELSSNTKWYQKYLRSEIERILDIATG